MDVLSSRILLGLADLDRSRRFYRDVLGLAIYREFGPPDDPGVVFFLGPGTARGLRACGGPWRVLGDDVWIQVRDVRAEHARLTAAGVSILREPATEPWGLIEMWIEDPDLTASASSWSRFPRIILSAVTHDPRHRQHDDPYAAREYVPGVARICRRLRHRR